jgi:serine/threonine protein kinase
MVGDDPAGDAGFPAGIAGGLVNGALVGGYRLERPLGRGGMAVVYMARDARLDRLVALKLLAPGLGADEGFRTRFVRESRAAAAVDHPHIIPVFDAGEADGMLYIAMRYVPGGDAGTIVRRDGPLGQDRAAAIIGQVASALDAAHAAGLVHRDVKPANMLVDVRSNRPDHVYLSDFGLSKTLTASARLTGTGQFLGTLDYIAPEQMQGRPTDGRTDQYGLACTAFELLTGAPPFRHEEASAVMYAHLTEPPPAVSARRPDLPPGIDQVLARAMAKAPESRYPSCQAFADALLDVLGTPLSRSRPPASAGLAPDYPPTQAVPAGHRPASAGQPAAAFNGPGWSDTADTIASAIPAAAAATGPFGGSSGTSGPGSPARDSDQRPPGAGRTPSPTPPGPYRSGRLRWAVPAAALVSAGLVAGLLVWAPWSTAGTGGAAPAPASSVSSTPAQSVQPWAGVWQDNTTAYLTNFTVRIVGGKPTVVLAADTSPENFSVKASRWNGAQLGWSYYVPSTTYTVTYTGCKLAGDAMACSWSNDHDVSGSVTLKRVSS